MTNEEILKNLCYYDKRNPDYCILDEDAEDHKSQMSGAYCYCDNCFYGRTKLAVELLKTRHK